MEQKFWKSWWFSPREKERSCQSFLRKEEFLPSMVAELGWAGSWEFVIFLDFRMVPDSVLLTVVFSVGDWSTVVSGPLPFIPSPIGVIVRAISRAPTQFANLFRSRGSVPRDFLLCSFHSWNGGPVKKINWGLISLSVVTLSPPLFLFGKNWGRDENIIVWEDRWAWGSCYKKTSGGIPSFSFVVCFIIFYSTSTCRFMHPFWIAVHAFWCGWWQK